MKTIEWYNGSKQELRQAISSGVEFAFVSPDNKQVSPFAYCKDYLQDAVQGYIHKQKKSIYGFTYDPKVHATIATKKTCLLIANSKDFNFGSKMPNCLDFLHQIESHLKMRKTKVEQCENPPLQYIRCGVWYIDGSARWIKSPPMISMYTLLIRIGFVHTIGENYKKTIDDIISGVKIPYMDCDKCRLKDAKKGIDKILKTGDRVIFGSKIKSNYPAVIKTPTMHNNLGIGGFSLGRTKKYIPFWHAEKEKELENVQ